MIPIQGAVILQLFIVHPSLFFLAFGVALALGMKKMK